MKKYSLITIKFGEGMINFINGIMEFSDEDKLEIHVKKERKNLNSLLEAGVDFDSNEESYRFYVNWGSVYGVEV
jgi:hypothetical protein